MSNQNGHLWDGTGVKTAKDFGRKCAEWQERDWMTWLAENLVFPFTATREEDDDEAYFQEGAAQAPFRLGHTIRDLLP